MDDSATLARRNRELSILNTIGRPLWAPSIVDNILRAQQLHQPRHKAQVVDRREAQE